MIALLRGEATIARTSGLGAILVALLLTPGLAFLCGFYANPRNQYGRSTELHFSSEAAQITVSQLVPATFLLLAPSLVSNTVVDMEIHTNETSNRTQLLFTGRADTTQDPKLILFVRAISPVVLLSLFALVLYLQLWSHCHIFSPRDEPGDEPEMLYGTNAADVGQDEQDSFTPWFSCIILVITTLWITICGDLIVISLGENLGTEILAGTVILPIITGGAEILSSVMATIRGTQRL